MKYSIVKSHDKGRIVEDRLWKNLEDIDKRVTALEGSGSSDSTTLSDLEARIQALEDAQDDNSGG